MARPMGHEVLNRPLYDYGALERHSVNVLSSTCLSAANKSERNEGFAALAGPTQSFAFLRLPIEIRLIIYKIILINPLDPHVPRRNMKSLPGLRYRHNQKRNLWRAMVLEPKKWDTSLAGGFDPTDWYDIFKHHTFVKPVKSHGFFHLIQTSKAISNEAREVFFRSHHFVFETGLALHEFLDIIGDNAKYITSMSVHTSNIRVLTTDRICKGLDGWQLRVSYHRPSIVQTIEKIGSTCPDLVYLEMLLGKRCQSDNREYMRGMHYTQWPWVEALRTLHVKIFTFCQPLEESLHRNRSMDEAKWKEEKEIEKYVND
jgi:hypothetical protein